MNLSGRAQRRDFFMLILDAVNVKKYFGDREILSFEQIQIRSGDKIGVVGRNGSGKSTLLNILSGDILPDEGSIKRHCDIAYIKQFSYSGEKADCKVLSEFSVQSRTHTADISGGERTRLKIASALSRNSALLFADEPTANLDFDGIQLLKKKLEQAETLVMISHDRELLDCLCNKIIEISDGKLSFFDGNYSFYKQKKQEITAREWFEYDKYIDEKKQLEEAIVNRKMRAKSVKKAPSRMGNSEARLHKRRSNEMQEKIFDAAKNIQTRIEKMEVKNKPKEIPVIKMDFSLTNPPKNKIVIAGDNLSFAYGQNEILYQCKFHIHNGLKYAVIGGNGAGKTTLLNQIYNRCKGINIVPRAEVGYFYQGFENLEFNKTVLDNVMKNSVQNETTARTILSRLLISSESIYKKIDVLSGGERIKVSFAKLFVSGANVLLLDEPTNYLDVESIEALQKILCQYEGTVVFVSHDKSFVNSIAQKLLIIENKKVIEFEGNIESYEIKSTTVKKTDDIHMQKMLLKMRITEVMSKLSYGNSDRDKLEAEYQQLIHKMNTLN
jgi:macrolide transport system ATP-binding/permease protein